MFKMQCFMAEEITYKIAFYLCNREVEFPAASAGNKASSSYFDEED